MTTHGESLTEAMGARNGLLRPKCHIKVIQWTLSSHLEDIDFADDLAVLSTNAQHLQDKTNRLTKYALQTGLIINTTKTQVMSINTTTQTQITINEELKSLMTLCIWEV